MTHGNLPLAVALMGPTASGKTRLAIQLAQALDGEVISVDSGLVYRGMDIGTAKPSAAERQGIPHHLIDILDPAETFSTGEFRTQALALMDSITARGRTPILAGGTMLYFHGLFNGLAELPSADPEVRAQIDREAERYGWEKLHEDLARIDPVAAARIHRNDPQRIQRALEVFRITGRSLTDLWRQSNGEPTKYRYVRLVVSPTDRDKLGQKIRNRFLQMLRLGFMEEVQALYARGDLNETMPSIRAVGYRQVWAHLAGEWDEAEMIERAVIATRQFAKRQYTWLRREETAVRLDSDDPKLLRLALAAVGDNA